MTGTPCAAACCISAAKPVANTSISKPKAIHNARRPSTSPLMTSVRIVGAGSITCDNTPVMAKVISSEINCIARNSTMAGRKRPRRIIAMLTSANNATSMSMAKITMRISLISPPLARRHAQFAGSSRP